MGIFITSNLADVRALDGVYGVEVAPPAPIRAPGQDWVGFVGRFAWGPVNQVVVIESTGQYLDTFAPAGQGYGTTGHQAIARTQPANLKIVRVAGAGAATAAMTLQGPNSVPATVSVLTVTAKYPGALPITIAIGAADDGVATHFNLTVTSGTETETYRNLAVVSGGVVLGDQSASKFIAALAAVTASLDAVTRPVNGTYTLGAAATNVTGVTAGSDGALGAASTYLGTPGTGDAGLARLEGDPDVTIVCTDDATTTYRDAVNDGLVAHAISQNVYAVICEDSGTTLANALASLAARANAQRSERAIYAWPWAYTLNEAGSEVLVPPAAFVAGALSHMPRHLGTHWKDPRNTTYYRKITRLEYTVGRANLILAKNAGVQVLVQTAAGGIAPKSGVTTSLVAGQTTVARRRLADFILRGLGDGQEPYEGGPIDPVTRTEQRARVENFLRPLKEAGTSGEAALTEAIADYAVTDLASAADLAAGVNRIGVRVRSFATQDAIAFIVTVGTSVTVDEVAAA